ncbi:MAG: NUDIX domain-containing protein [Patescibacteria group bacterium]
MIPKNAKLVHKGILFDVYQWQQEMFDGTTKTYEKLERKDSVTILPVTTDGMILLGREEQPGREPFISIPGGQVEEGEEPEEAARREFLEETGYEARELELWQTVHPYGNKIDWDVYGYVGRGCKKVADQNLDSGEKIQLELVSFDDFIQIAAFDENFRVEELTKIVLRAMLQPEEMQKLKWLLFGK